MNFNDDVILLTGGAGFIGSELMTQICKSRPAKIIVLDILTYAGEKYRIDRHSYLKNFFFIKGNICDSNLLKKIFDNYQPNIIINCAAESHVDNSIATPDNFIKTNILGTFELLEISRKSWKNFEKKLFIQVSTDEVYGSLLASEKPFSELSNYKPNSPYSASKASADHLVRSWFRTYNLPTIVTNCTNNYGPEQNNEKLIPLVIFKCLKGENIPIYGDGNQIRDWIHVSDHANAILKISKFGKIGSQYNIGSKNEISNLTLVKIICNILDKEIILKPRNIKSFNNLITFVKDRPGHDLRYAVDPSKVMNEVGWEPTKNIELGLTETINWYILKYKDLIKNETK